MPRDGSGVYSKPSGTTASPNTTIESAKFNSVVDDLVTDANAARPIPAGGTGATSASAARTALGLEYVTQAEAEAGLSTSKVMSPLRTLQAIGSKTVDTRTSLKSLDTASIKAVILNEAGREGLFLWKSGDYSTQISSDTSEGIYIKADAIASTSGAWVREFEGSANVQWFGAIGDGSADDYTSITAALASGQPVYFPKPSVKYKHATPIAISGTKKYIRCDPNVLFHYTGVTGAAWTITGSYHDIEIEEILASSAPYCVGYWNLQFSKIRIGLAGQCTTANILHDAGLQTANAGNNDWTVDLIQGGGVPYGVDIQSHATYILEGETWDLPIIFSNTVCSLRIGTSGKNTARWNEYHVAPDGQGITPMLVDVYNDSNFINIRKWAGLATAPPIAHVRFNTGTGSNILFSQPGTFGPLTVLDTPGSNFSFVPGQAGVMKMIGKLGVGIDLPGTKLHVADTLASGGNVIRAENMSTANSTAKSTGVVIVGRDTVNTSKDVARLLSVPKDANWQATQTILYGRDGDALVPALFLHGVGTPESVVTAPPGSLYTRTDGAAATTLYVKTSGTGNTGWTAK